MYSIYQYSHSSLMASQVVHISIYHESHISCPHLHSDFDTMMVIYCPDIVLSWTSPHKAEQISHFLICGMITKQLIFIDKARLLPPSLSIICTSAPRIPSIILLLARRCLCIKNLVHRSLKSSRYIPVRSITNPVELADIIISALTISPDHCHIIYP